MGVSLGSNEEKNRVEVVEMNYLRKACGISRLEYVPNEMIKRRTEKVFTNADTVESRQLM